MRLCTDLTLACTICLFTENEIRKKNDKDSKKNDSILVYLRFVNEREYTHFLHSYNLIKYCFFRFNIMPTL